MLENRNHQKMFRCINKILILFCLIYMIAVKCSKIGNISHSLHNNIEYNESRTSMEQECSDDRANAAGEHFPARMSEKEQKIKSKDLPFIVNNSPFYDDPKIVPNIFDNGQISSSQILSVTEPENLHNQQRISDDYEKKSDIKCDDRNVVKTSENTSEQNQQQKFSPQVEGETAKYYKPSNQKNQIDNIQRKELKNVHSVIDFNCASNILQVPSEINILKENPQRNQNKESKQQVFFNTVGNQNFHPDRILKSADDSMSALRHTNNKQEYLQYLQCINNIHPKWLHYFQHTNNTDQEYLQYLQYINNIHPKLLHHFQHTNNTDQEYLQYLRYINNIHQKWLHHFQCTNKTHQEWLLYLQYINNIHQKWLHYFQYTDNTQKEDLQYLHYINNIHHKWLHYLQYTNNTHQGYLQYLQYINNVHQKWLHNSQYTDNTQKEDVSTKDNQSLSSTRFLKQTEEKIFNFHLGDQPISTPKETLNIPNFSQDISTRSLQHLNSHHYNNKPVKYSNSTDTKNTDIFQNHHQMYLKKPNDQLQNASSKYKAKSNRNNSTDSKKNEFHPYSYKKGPSVSLLQSPSNTSNKVLQHQAFLEQPNSFQDNSDKQSNIQGNPISTQVSPATRQIDKLAYKNTTEKTLLEQLQKLTEAINEQNIATVKTETKNLLSSIKETYYRHEYLCFVYDDIISFNNFLDKQYNNSAAFAKTYFLKLILENAGRLNLLLSEEDPKIFKFVIQDTNYQRKSHTKFNKEITEICISYLTEYLPQKKNFKYLIMDFYHCINIDNFRSGPTLKTKKLYSEGVLDEINRLELLMDYFSSYHNSSLKNTQDYLNHGSTDQIHFLSIFYEIIKKFLKSPKTRKKIERFLRNSSIPNSTVHNIFEEKKKDIQ